MGGWLYELKIRLNSAFNSVEIEVEVEAELGKNILLNDYVPFSTHKLSSSNNDEAVS